MALRGREWHDRLHVMSRSSSARHVRQYRERMKQAGLRLVQFWVPDTRVPGFAEECRRQSQRTARRRLGERDTLDWLDHARDTDGWTP